MVRGDLELSRVAFLLDPSWFSSVEGLSIGETDHVGGRPAIRVKSPQPADPDQTLWPGIGWAGFLPEYELRVDAEKGILLRTAERFRGADYQVVELLDVQFDLPIPDDTFKLILPAGQEFQRWEDIAPRQLALEEAARSAPFTVYAPQKVPEGVGTPDEDVLYVPSPAAVVIGYTDPEQVPQMRLEIIEGATGTLDDHTELTRYEPVEREGQAMLVRSEQSEDGEWHSLLTERDGTHISIYAMLDREATIAVALSLKPVPRS